QGWESDQPPREESNLDDRLRRPVPGIRRDREIDDTDVETRWRAERESDPRAVVLQTTLLARSSARGGARRNRTFSPGFGGPAGHHDSALRECSATRGGKRSLPES